MRPIYLLLFFLVFSDSLEGQNPLDLFLLNEAFEPGRKFITADLSKIVAERKDSSSLIFFEAGVLYIPRIKNEDRIDTVTLEVISEGDSISHIKTNHSLILPKGRRFIPAYADRNCVSCNIGYMFQFLELNSIHLEDEIIPYENWNKEKINDFVVEFNQGNHTKKYNVKLPQKHEWRSMDSWNTEGKTKMNLGVMPSTYEDEVGNIYVVFKEGYYSKFREVLCSSRPSTTTIEIQQALKDKGYDVEVNDVMSEKTKAAIIQFQKDNNLPHGNLNMETLRALGIQY